MNTINKIRCWLCRKMFHVVTKVDYSIKAGDVVTSSNWSLTSLHVVSVNWALSAVAVQLGPVGSVVVWPVWAVKKVSSP